MSIKATEKTTLKITFKKRKKGLKKVAASIKK